MQGKYFLYFCLSNLLIDMLQDLIIYALITTASAYMGYRIYGSIKKKQACDKCTLMEAAKKNNQ